MFIPMIIAVIVQKFVYKEPIKEPLGISFRWNRWFVVAWFLLPIVAFATFGVSLLLPGVEFSPEKAGMFEKFKVILTPEQLQQMEEQIIILLRRLY